MRLKNMTDYIAKAEFKLTAKIEREKLKEIIILLDLQKKELSKQKVVIDYRSGQYIKTKQQILPLGPKYEVIDSQGIKLSLKDIHAFYSVCKADDFEKERNLLNSATVVGYLDEYILGYQLFFDSSISPIKGIISSLHVASQRSAVEQLYCYLLGHYFDLELNLHGFEKNSDAYWVGVCPVIFNEES
ncbi:hypothetical protein GKC33_04250 [Lactobacillus salivarius]|uniref:Uncharacterized protein n=1 Tax=Ligilactobacillus salivarius TaxID=1624 RepID=A0A6A8LTW9_9LACO|nr:hypothetical protein [Ligilactobacillus salivarius]MSE07956.1 hypothetical protein [Ligilactobacillus salivarius]